MVDAVVGRSGATPVGISEAAFPVNAIGAAPLVRADPAPNAPLTVAEFEAVDIPQPGPHVGWITSWVGVAVKGDRVGLGPRDVAAEVDINQHVAQEVGGPLEAVQRLLHERDEVIDPADERSVIIGAVRPVAGAHEFEVIPVNTAGVASQHPLNGSLGEQQFEVFVHGFSPRMGYWSGCPVILQQGGTAREAFWWFESDARLRSG